MNETWAQLEPRDVAENWADLDTSLAAVTAYNASHQSTQLGVKLHVSGGRIAPDWVKALGGLALSGIAASRAGVTVCRWWTLDYRTAWSAFEHAPRRSTILPGIRSATTDQLRHSGSSGQVGGSSNVPDRRR